MIGITSVGSYIPMFRLSQKEIGRMWNARGGDGERAVAGYDEDSVTMGVGAGLNCIRRAKDKVDGLYFATTSSPYTEKQCAAIIAAAIDIGKESSTADFTNSLRAGTSAMKSAIDAIKAGSSSQVLVIASDCRIGAPKGSFEQTLGDGAAALMIGSKNVIASIEGVYTISSDFTDLWRTGRDAFVKSGETRFIEEEGYLHIMEGAIAKLMKMNDLKPTDISKLVFYAPNKRNHAAMAQRLAFDKTQVLDNLYASIGNTGAAAAILMLVAALEEAKAGDRILFAGYGDGADCFILRATDAVSNVRDLSTLKDRISRKTNVDYGTYLYWRDLVPTEASSLPERSEPSLASRWRERKMVTALYGYKCRKCGTPQLNPNGKKIRICINCQAKDDFEDYKFSDKTGKLFTYAVDQLQPTKNSPGLNGIIDFDGGGRFISELTDYDIEKAHVGMPVEMTFRKLFQGKGIINYFWKAKPLMR